MSRFRLVPVLWDLCKAEVFFVSNCAAERKVFIQLGMKFSGHENKDTITWDSQTEMWGGVVHEQRILILTYMLHVSVGLEKLQGQSKEVCGSLWRQGGAVSGAIPLSSPFGELKSRVVQKSMVRSCRVMAKLQRWLGSRCRRARN